MSYANVEVMVDDGIYDADIDENFIPHTFSLVPKLQLGNEKSKTYKREKTLHAMACRDSHSLFKLFLSEIREKCFML